jgi:hypothetical protein
MLSVLQRLNIALRTAEFDELVSISVNNKLLYENNGNDKANLAQGPLELSDSYKRGDIHRVNTLALTVDADINDLRFLIQVKINPKPKAGATPVIIELYGFISEFKKQPNESEQELSKRVEQLIDTTWGDKEKRESRLLCLEQKFTEQVQKLQHAINQLFPAQSEARPIERKMRKDPFTSKHHYHQDRYLDFYAYIPLFYLYGVGSGDITQEDYILDESVHWDADHHDMNKDNSGDTGWAIGDGSDSPSSDGGSSCGSSCGGGCGS